MLLLYLYAPSMKYIFTATAPNVIPCLVRPSRCLTSLQLIHIPATNRQIASILIHALIEPLRIVLAHPWRLVLTVHVRVVVSRIHHSLILLLLLFGGKCFAAVAGAATEKPSDCVPDGGSHCYACGC